MRNIGGQPFTNLSATLTTTSPYITITDNSGAFGAIPIDSTKENLGDPFVIQAAANAPNGQAAPFRLICQESGFCDTFDFTLIIGSMHYLVWNPDPTPSSGQTIDSLLRDLNYSGTILTNLPDPTVMEAYRTVFVCAGIYPNNHLILANSAEAATLVDFVNAGGRIYMEGGDVWFYDPLLGGYDFCPLFGVTPVADGSGDLGPIAGRTGTFTNQMDFAYAGENNYMDHISPAGTGSFLIFQDDSLWDCGVARDAGAYRSVGASFELGSLVDGSGVSTRRALVDSIMKFFGIAFGAGEGSADRRLIPLTLTVAPNPFRHRIALQVDPGIGHSAEGIEIKIYDAAGRSIIGFTRPSALCSLPFAFHWDGKDRSGRTVPGGIYFVRLEAGGSSRTEKVILVR